MLTCSLTISFHHEALHVVIEFSLVEYDMCSSLLFLYCIYTTRQLLRWTLWGFPWRVWWVLGIRSPVSCLWRTSACVSFPLLATRTILSWDIRSCNKCLMLSLPFTLCFGIHWVDACVQLDPGAHVFLHSYLSLNLGVTLSGTAVSLVAGDPGVPMSHS
jgi:hypothetical protein